jgi:hypothetical protein
MLLLQSFGISTRTCPVIRRIPSKGDGLVSCLIPRRPLHSVGAPFDISVNSKP